MTERKQARAMDLPDYPSPPSVSEIATHAGSWGWINPGHVAQDSDGYLWVKGDAVPRPAPQPPYDFQALTAWAENGIALYVGRKGYGHIQLLRGSVDETLWVPVASVMKEPPAYASHSFTGQ